MNNRLFRFAFAATVTALAFVLWMGSFFFLSGEKEGEISANERKRAFEEVMYGHCWSPLQSMVLDLRGCFEAEKDLWKKKYPHSCPFLNSAPLPIAEEQWYRHWLAVQIEILKEKGWRLTTTAEGGFVFERVDPAPLPQFKMKHWEEKCNPPVFPAPLPGQAVQLFPRYFTALNPKYGKSGKTEYAGGGIMIPPIAHSLRIYAAVPINARFYRFRDMPYLHIPEIAKGLYKVGYDADRYNVIRIDFVRDIDGWLTPDKFWRWRILSLQMGPMPGYSFDWLAWEFLDEDGKPLPADYPLPTRWFPDNFKEIFKPIPLPENMKSLPEAQD